MSSKIVLLTLVFLAIITRFTGIFWGNGYFFHPDENNMATSISQMSLHDLNPKFFAYGQFPLYLGFASLQIIHIPNTFSNSVYILRFWSAVFSLVSLFILYKIYPNKIFLLLLIFSPGLIQLSHFGTTESLLIFVFSVCLYLSIYKPNNYFLYSLILGIGIASKISAFIFVVPFVVANSKKPFILILTFIFSILFGILLSPYNLISLNDFQSSMQYETTVATGKTLVFYTTQFKNSLPYLFQIEKIFPYVSGLSIFVISFFAVFYFKINRKSTIIIISTLVYFLYFGQLYVKWTRFMSPIFFVFPLLAALVISKQQKIYKVFLILISIIPGVVFFTQYFQPDIRITATNWITQNLPPGSNILSESGNVVNLPMSPDYQVNSFDFYSQTSSLVDAVTQADYVIVPSRRVFKNYNLPYHRNLFSGDLGFSQIKTLSPISDLILNQESAEETWSVFDRPTIRIFQKKVLLTPQEYAQKL